MHGLVNRSIQRFVQETYGAQPWHAIAAAIGVDPEGFEPLLRYDDALSRRLLEAAAAELEKPPEVLLEDMGTCLVGNPGSDAIRRLLRFGGDSFEEFLHSLEDLPDRARLALCDLELPELELRGDDGSFTLVVRGNPREFAFVLVGVLRAMADDYGALAVLEHAEDAEGCPMIGISLLDSSFADGREFCLSPRLSTADGETAGIAADV